MDRSRCRHTNSTISNNGQNVNESTNEWNGFFFCVIIIRAFKGHSMVIAYRPYIFKSNFIFSTSQNFLSPSFFYALRSGTNWWLKSLHRYQPSIENFFCLLVSYWKMWMCSSVWPFCKRSKWNIVEWMANRKTFNRLTMCQRLQSTSMNWLLFFVCMHIKIVVWK